MGSIGNYKSNKNIVSMIHYTQPENIDNIIKNDFDFSKSGEGAGNVWGDGAYYLEKGSYEDDRYSLLLDTESYIQSNIDTTDMLRVNLPTSEYRSENKMYDDAAKSFTGNPRKEYNIRKKQYGNKEAFNSVAKEYYTGVIIQQNNKNRVDAKSGGNQIVVYDRSVIKSKKANR